jgi:hypothetical protein
LGGGGDVQVSVSTDTSKVELIQSVPVPNTPQGVTPNAWQVEAVTDLQTVGSVTVTAYVLCNG